MRIAAGVQSPDGYVGYFILADAQGGQGEDGEVAWHSRIKVHAAFRVLQPTGALVPLEQIFSRAPRNEQSMFGTGVVYYLRAFQELRYSKTVTKSRRGNTRSDQARAGAQVYRLKLNRQQVSQVLNCISFVGAAANRYNVRMAQEAAKKMASGSGS